MPDPRKKKTGGEEKESNKGSLNNPRIGDKVHGAPYLPPGGVSTFQGWAPEYEYLAKKEH